MADSVCTFNSDVNQFPSLTWNHLNINRGHLEACAKGELHFSCSKLPAGIVFERKACSGLSSDFSSIVTGMGKNFDSQFDGAMKGLEAQVNLYRVAEGTKADACVHLFLDKGDGIADTLIIAQKGSDSNFIFEFSGDSGKEGLVGCRIKLVAAEAAHVSIALVNLLTGDCVHFDSVGARIQDGASVEVTELQLGASKVYSGSRYELEGRSSSFDGRLAYLVDKDHSLDVNYEARQSGRDTQSSMMVNGVVSDKGAKTWRGTIDFVKGAVDAKGDEQEDVLLLSPGVVNKSLPVILCGEEAVDGRHGSSIGRLGADVLFYMQSRGIDSLSAKKIMVKSKISSVSHYVHDASVIERINHHLEGAFA